ncbi:hypothetical protein SEVIR_9G577500v4 [Setaria viridis]|uniref:Uncharacterized protein n=2 Tax=Setaria TaxID=4554 RepID=A0A368SX54_SETIT|nr:hypothetical protein SETIT_9G573800v2 [Setaria italica]TKV98714.1 hypothetical protein SEVIR_9G577500v2 [Setaria viridis]
MCRGREGGEEGGEGRQAQRHRIGSPKCPISNRSGRVRAGNSPTIDRFHRPNVGFLRFLLRRSSNQVMNGLVAAGIGDEREGNKDGWAWPSGDAAASTSTYRIVTAACRSNGS